jgi:Big-like domain-containing protein/VCBS repeat protein/centrosomal CEP192-like protein
MSTQPATICSVSQFARPDSGCLWELAVTGSAARTRRGRAALCRWGLRIFALALLLSAFVGHAWAGGPANPAPRIAAISPVSLTSGATNVTLAVEGDGFVQTSVVKWNGTPLTTTYVSAIKLTASVPDLLVFTDSTASIIVANPRNGGTPIVSNTVFLPISGSEASVNFGAGLPTTVGNFPIVIGAGDFNGDGKIDLAVGNGDDNSMSILIGNGDGTFTTNTTLSLSGTPIWIDVNDYNGDGIPDIAVAISNSPGSISVFLGAGDGTFTLKSSPAVGDFPEQFAVGDFNGDGNLDFVAADENGTDLTILLGNGDGTFTLGTTPPAVPYGTSVGAGDFNEDGKLDLAIADSNGVDILLGNGDGTFQSPTTVTNGSFFTQSVVVADFNNDGHLDFAGVDNGSAYVFLGDGTGSFTMGSAATVSQDAEEFGIVAGDFNGDGNVDIVVGILNPPVPPFTSPVTFYLMTGDGGGNLRSAQFIANGDSAPYQLAAADFNNDGVLDVALDPGSTSISAFVQVLPVALSPASVSFAATNIGTSNVTIPMTLTNNTGGQLNIMSVSVTGAESGDFVLSNNTCVQSVAAGGTCSVSVTFAPSAAGSRTALLTFTDGDCSPQTQTIPLTGLGIQAIPTMTLAPNLSFTSQAVGSQSGAQAVTLSVTNAVTLNIATIAVSGTNSGDFSESDNCGTSVLGDASCTINVKFQPTTAGTRSASLTVTDNAADSPESITLTGTAVQGTPTITWPNPADIAYGTALGTTQLDASAGRIAGSFAYTPAAGTVLGLGSHTLSATFTPTDTTDYSSTTATATINVTKAPTTTTLAQPTSSYFGDNVTLAATVASTTTGTPTGTVTFVDGSTILGTGALNSSGVATYSTSSLTVGSHTFTANYGGDANYNSSTVTNGAYTVNATFSIADIVAPIIVRRNVATAVAITVPPSGGAYNGSVTLSITGLPPGATGSFSPSVVTPGGSGASSTLTLNFSSAVSKGPTGGGKLPLLPALVSALCGMLLFTTAFLVNSANRLRLSRALAIVGCIALAAMPSAFVAGCGSVAAPQSFTATVTGASGSVQHSTTLMITLE